MTLGFLTQCLLVDVTRNADIPAAFLQWDFIYQIRQYHKMCESTVRVSLASHLMGIASEYPNLIRWTAA